MWVWLVWSAGGMVMIGKSMGVVVGSVGAVGGSVMVSMVGFCQEMRGPVFCVWEFDARRMGSCWYVVGLRFRVWVGVPVLPSPLLRPFPNSLTTVGNYINKTTTIVTTPNGAESITWGHILLDPPTLYNFWISITIMSSTSPVFRENVLKTV